MHLCRHSGKEGPRDRSFAHVMVNCTVGTALRSKTLIAFVPLQLVLIGIGTGHRCLLWPGNTEGDYLRKLESPAMYVHTMFCMSGRPHIPILKRTIRWHCLEALPPSIFHDLLLSRLWGTQLPLKSSEKSHPSELWVYWGLMLLAYTLSHILFTLTLLSFVPKKQDVLDTLAQIPYLQFQSLFPKWLYG